MSKYASLEMVLGKEAEELTAVEQGEFTTKKLGVVPYTAIDHKEYKAAKKDCMKMIPNGTGGMVPDLDDDKLMVKIIIAAVDKDTRTDFTFANEALIKKLQAANPGIVSADQVVTKLLSPGEIYKFAVEVQNASGFGADAKKELKDDVKNS